ncbi:hypothetical protein EDB85DRAFT_1888805 [Lactarius pseudohatsudake]|nr:hypothetical protein EDB85DRAFT_1888805 [Lactarius pseudohatsudake]
MAQTEPNRTSPTLSGGNATTFFVLHGDRGYNPRYRAMVVWYTMVFLHRGVESYTAGLTRSYGCGAAAGAVSRVAGWCCCGGGVAHGVGAAAVALMAVQRDRVSSLLTGWVDVAVALQMWVVQWWLRRWRHLHWGSWGRVSRWRHEGGGGGVKVVASESGELRW